MDKIKEKNKLRFPPLTCRDAWFNLSQLPQETIPQFIRRLNTEMATSYLESGLTKNQLLIQKTLSNIKDKKIQEDVLQKYNSLKDVWFEEYLSFIETNLSMREASIGHIHLQK